MPDSNLVWKYSKDLVARDCPDLVNLIPRRGFGYSAHKTAEVVAEMQKCKGRSCVAFYLDVSGEPLCRKYGGPIFIRSLDAVRRELAKESADE